MRKQTFCICENKDADQLRGKREADQRLCFRYTDNIIPLLSKPQAIFCSCTALFVSDQVGNQNICFLVTQHISGAALSRRPLRQFELYTSVIYPRMHTVLKFWTV